MTEQTTPTQITISDFNMVIAVIDVCAQRGAFKGEEMVDIGNLRGKFASFIKEHEAATQNLDEGSDEEPSQAVDPNADEVEDPERTQPTKRKSRAKKS